MFLEKKLKAWVAKQIITAKQADQIKAYEMSQPNKPYIFYGFITLGAVIIGTGIVTLVSAHWENISDGVKLSVDFALLTALATSCFWAWKQKHKVLLHILLVVFLLSCFASIGLISEIYHTGGDIYNALLFCSLITVGVSMISNSFFIAFVWTVSLLVGWNGSIESTFLWDSIFYDNTSFYMTTALIWTLLTLVFKALTGESVHTRSFKWCSLFMVCASLFSAEAFSSIKADSLMIFVPSYIVAVLNILVGSLFLNYSKTQRMLFLACLFVYLIFFHLIFFDVDSDLIYGMTSVCILLSMSLLAASFQWRKLFQFFLIITGIRLVVIYFQVLEGLATTGIGLIVSGILLITLVALLHKYYQSIIKWTYQLVK